MIVVADASPIICLTRIGRLHLLPDLFGVVIIPTTVRDEIAAGSHGHDILAACPWIEVRSVSDSGRLEALAVDLDRGEAAAIALALECSADALLIDERIGRRIASSHGIFVVGVVGVVLRAHRERLIQTVRPVLDELVTKADFWLSPDVLAAALRSAGEEA